METIDLEMSRLITFTYLVQYEKKKKNVEEGLDQSSHGST